MFATDLIRLFQAQGKFGIMVTAATEEPRLKKYMSDFELTFGEGIPDGTE